MSELDGHRPLRVVVCEDDTGLRAVISGIVEETGGMVLAETDSSADATHLIDHFDPDVVIIDLGLVRGSGMDIVDRIRERGSDTNVIVFTAFDGLTGIPIPGGQVIHKPDFDKLAEALTTIDRQRHAVDRA